MLVFFSDINEELPCSSLYRVFACLHPIVRSENIWNNYPWSLLTYHYICVSRPLVVSPSSNGHATYIRKVYNLHQNSFQSQAPFPHPRQPKITAWQRRKNETIKIAINELNNPIAYALRSIDQHDGVMGVSASSAWEPRCWWLTPTAWHRDKFRAPC